MSNNDYSLGMRFETVKGYKDRSVSFILTFVAYEMATNTTTIVDYLNNEQSDLRGIKWEKQVSFYDNKVKLGYAPVLEASEMNFRQVLRVGKLMESIVNKYVKLEEKQGEVTSLGAMVARIAKLMKIDIIHYIDNCTGNDCVIKNSTYLETERYVNNIVAHATKIVNYAGQSQQENILVK
jgi:hypothetical protein